MNKLKENAQKLLEKIKALSKRKKIAFGSLALGLLIVVVYLIVYFSRTNYAVLFKDMDANDAQVVLAKLNEKKVECKIENNTIKVPEDKAAELRMELAPSLNNGSKGYEILDEGSKWGMTDKEMDTKYQIALQGELQKTIETFPEVEKADVKLVMNASSDFFKKEEPAQASVTLHFKTGQKVNNDQIKAIASLVAGSVKNLPKENVKIIGVINGTTSVLSEGLFDEDSNALGNVTDKQREYEKNIEKEYEKKIMTLLSTKYGSGVQATVDVEADFNASEKTATTWDKAPVVRSEKTVKDTNTDSAEKSNTSPVDDNMSNTYTAGKGKNATSSHEESTKNYEVGKVEEKVVAAPGKIKKVSASIIVNDSNLSEAEKGKIQNTVSAAIGYDQTRGDIVSIEGMNFDSNNNDVTQEETEKAKEIKKKKLMYYAGAGIAAIALIALVIVLIKKRRNKEDDMEDDEHIDMLISDEIKPKELLKPLEFDDENESTHVEKEIKKYASEKPEQVAEIIKAWMAEDER